MQLIYTIAVTVPDDKTAILVSNFLEERVCDMLKHVAPATFDLLTFKIAGEKEVRVAYRKEVPPPRLEKALNGEETRQFDALARANGLSRNKLLRKLIGEYLAVKT